MPFEQTSIVEVKPPTWDGATLHLSWVSTSPPGTTFQVYVGRRLAWYGTSRWVSLTIPDSRVRIDVGTVGPGETTADFSAMLPPSPGDRVTLSWHGGSYLDPSGGDDVRGFLVHGSRRAGWEVDHTEPLADLPAYPGGTPIDGFGIGEYGRGGFGRAASTYRWTSAALGPGTWTFEVVSYDSAGNRGIATTLTTTVVAPPRPPAADQDGSRLRCSYDPVTRKATLSWNPSPS